MEKEKLGRILKKSLIGTLIVGSLGTLAITSLVNLDNYLTTKTNFNKIVNTEKKNRICTEY